MEKEAIATAISIGFPIDVTRAADDFYPLLVANSYFGEHRTFNGLLMNVMRGARGLNYGDYSYIENFIQEGFSRLPAPNIPRRQQFFSIWIRPVAHHNAHFALRQALRELQRLVEHGLSPEDFEATRDFLINYSQLYVQTTDRRLGYLLDARLYEAGFLVDEIGERLPALTVDDVNAAVRRHLRFDDLAVAVVTSNAEEFRRAAAGERAVAADLQHRGGRRHPRRGRRDRRIPDPVQPRTRADRPRPRDVPRRRVAAGPRAACGKSPAAFDRPRIPPDLRWSP